MSSIEERLDALGGWLQRQADAAKREVAGPDVLDVVLKEVAEAGLPGFGNGPGDAYRHILWSAELTRRYGPVEGPRIAELNETNNWLTSRFGEAASASGLREERAMDRFNNAIGVEIGLRAGSFDDVLAEVRARIDRSDGSGARGTARWLAAERWNTTRAGAPGWPATDWSAVSRDHVNAYGARREVHRFGYWREQAELEIQRRLGLISATEGRRTSGCAGAVSVGGYVRSDGVRVGAHVRGCPATATGE